MWILKLCRDACFIKCCQLQMLFLSLEAQVWVRAWKTHSKWNSCRADLERSAGVGRLLAGSGRSSVKTKEVVPVLSELNLLPTNLWLLMHARLVLVHLRCSSTFSEFLEGEIPTSHSLHQVYFMKTQQLALFVIITPHFRQDRVSKALPATVHLNESGS